MRDSFGRRQRPRRLGRRLLVGTILVAATVAAGVVFWAGTEGPRARLLRPIEVVGATAPLELELETGRAGLESYQILLRREDGSHALLAEEKISKRGLLGSGVTRHQVKVDVNGAHLGVPEGPARIEVYASDHAAVEFWRSHDAILEIPITVDLTPPRIQVLGTTHYVRPGGSDLVVYEVEPGTETSAVRVAGREFPGEHPKDSPANVRVALYAIPHDAGEDFVAEVTAEDLAGNRRAVPFPVVLRVKSFPAEDIQVSDTFIDRTVRPLLRDSGAEDPPGQVDAFLAVNRDLRRTSEERLRELTAHSEPALTFGGALRQQPGSQVGSRFAARRTYFYDGEVVDQQDHLGYDLASVRQTPILAAQAGTVQAVTGLGIYGNIVLVDHGLGLSSLYAHLSSTDVEVGDRVEAGQPIGRSGETGLAAGDHLHFSVLIRGQHVDALEWWDPKWVQIRIQEPLAQAQSAPALPPTGTSG